MSTVIQCMGVKIYCKALYTQTASIGLYTNGSLSEFRWIENDLSGLTSPAWNSKMIAASGVPEITEEADFSRTGGMAIVSSLTLAIDNTSQFFKTIHDLEISLAGLRVDIIEFSQNVNTSVITQIVRYHGICKVDKWNEANYEIPIEPAILNRKSNLAKDVDITINPDASGTIYPITFGRFDDSRYAKMIRTVAQETNYVIWSLYAWIYSQTAILWTKWAYEIALRELFPIVNMPTSPALTLDIQLGTSEEIDMGSSWSVTGIDDLYIYISEDTGSPGASGQYRKITSIENISATTLRVTITEYWKNDPAYSATGAAAWCQLKIIKRQFNADFWKCLGFLDENGALVTAGIPLYVYSENQKIVVSGDPSVSPVEATIENDKLGYYQIPAYTYELVAGDVNRCSLIIRPSLCENGVDNVSSFIALPVVSPQLISDSTSEIRARWGFGNTISKIANGLYGTYPNDLSVVNVAGSIAVEPIDKDHTTFASYRIGGTTGSISYFCISFKLPAYPEGFGANAVYVGINTRNTPITESGLMTIAWRRFLGNSSNIIARAMSAIGASDNIARLESIPDFYYTSSKNDNGLYFFPSSDAVVIANKFCISGYSLYSISGADDNGKYKSIEELMLFFQMLQSSSSYPNTIDIYELAIIFEKKLAMGSELFVNFSGRIFNSDWGGSRRNPADTMIKPRDIMEHICRLQNFSDVAEEGSTVYGQTYATNALIKTSGDGSFDSTELNITDSIQIVWQILDKDKAWSDVMKQTICQAAWLASYVDENGYECVCFLPKGAQTTPTDIIDLGDIPKGYQIGDVEEPKEKDIFCEPIVNYDYDTGAQKFRKSLKILNTNLSAYDATKCQVGFNEFDGEHVWQSCRDDLWNKYHIVQQPPTQFTDLYCIYRYEDALWYLDNWLTMMTRKRITIAVAYNQVFGSTTTPASWHIGRHVILQLPHQTDDIQVECVIETISKSLAKGIVEMRLIILDDLPAGYYIKEVMYTKAQGADRDAKEMLSTTSPQMKEQM